MTQSDRSERGVEEEMGMLLRAGVMAAAAIVLVGALVFLARHGLARPHYRIFRGEPSDLRSLRGIARDVAAGHGRGMIQAGLLLLIATPVARVVYAVLAFARQRDRTYVALTLIVLSVLIYSLFWGRAS